MNRQLNLTLQYRYNHLELPHVLKDVRKKPLWDIKQDHVYFVGFRISAKAGDIYHHAMIIADDVDAFFDGIAGEYNAIMDLYLVTFHSAITLVFLRNLMMTAPDVIAAAEQLDLTAEIKECLSKRNDDLFSVFGMIGESLMCQIQINEKNGLLAIEAARKKARQLYGEELMLLEVCQAHPIRHEFDAMFAEEAKRFNSLLDDDSVGSGCVH